VLFVEQQLENPPTDRVAEDVEGVHSTSMSAITYIRQGL
jgi:hypothetical protein